MTIAEAIKRLETCDDCGDCLTCKAHDEAIEVVVTALKEQEECAKNAHWISVTERLPEELPENKGRKIIQCIVELSSCYPNGKATIQKRQRQVLYDYDGNPSGWEWSRIGKSRVTHWMPLPEPPADIRKGENG